jgi:hypothetical protein
MFRTGAVARLTAILCGRRSGNGFLGMCRMLIAVIVGLVTSFACLFTRVAGIAVSVFLNDDEQEA